MTAAATSVMTKALATDEHRWTQITPTHDSDSCPSSNGPGHPQGFYLRSSVFICGYAFRFCLPTQSRANCQATRPLREPRSSAQTSEALRLSSVALPPSVATQWEAISRY